VQGALPLHRWKTVHGSVPCLPVYTDVYRLVPNTFEYTQDFSRDYKYAPGQDLKRDSIVLVRMTTTAGVSNALGFMVSRQRPPSLADTAGEPAKRSSGFTPMVLVAYLRALPHVGSTPFLANILANTAIRDSGDGGTVWVCVEAGAAPQARYGATRNEWGQW